MMPASWGDTTLFNEPPIYSANGETLPLDIDSIVIIQAVLYILNRFRLHDCLATVVRFVSERQLISP